MESLKEEVFWKECGFNNICEKKSLHILNFLWLIPVNKELISKELICFSMSKAAANQTLIDLENLEMGLKKVRKLGKYIIIPSPPLPI